MQVHLRVSEDGEPRSLSGPDRDGSDSRAGSIRLGSDSKTPSPWGIGPQIHFFFIDSSAGSAPHHRLFSPGGTRASTVSLIRAVCRYATGAPFQSTKPSQPRKPPRRGLGRV